MAKALVAEGTPFGAPQIDTRITHLFLAATTDTRRLVFPKFDDSIALWATDIEDVSRYPITHVLPRTM
jgi:hypothetical protein